MYPCYLLERVDGGRSIAFGDVEFGQQKTGLGQVGTYRQSFLKCGGGLLAVAHLDLDQSQFEQEVRGSWISFFQALQLLEGFRCVALRSSKSRLEKVALKTLWILGENALRMCPRLAE